jgi:hypothetical protein
MKGFRWSGASGLKNTAGVGMVRRHCSEPEGGFGDKAGAEGNVDRDWVKRSTEGDLPGASPKLDG